MLDAGRGSIHVSLLSFGTLVGSVNEPLGIDRVLDRFHDLSDHPHFATTIDRQIGGSIRRMLGQFQLPPLEGLIVTGHEARELAELHCGVSPGPIARLEISMLEAWWHDESQRSSQERAIEQDGDIWRANRLLIINSIMRHLGQQTALEHIEIPSIRLRDGLIEDFKPGAPGPYNLDRRRLIASAHQMAERYGTSEAYAKNSASLAEQIFDQTANLHHLGSHERDLLSFATIVHDIGASIHVRNRHLHTAYILRASEIAGLTAKDKEIVALVTRLHRSGLPPLDGPEFTVLERRVRVVVLYLASILRLAYALDVERLQRIKTITCRVDGSRLLVVTDRRQVTLERWAARDKGDLFEMVFGLEPVILPRSEGQSG
jgi:exopolyphosphatase/pppGpp-phosphohydrolase